MRYDNTTRKDPLLSGKEIDEGDSDKVETFPELFTALVDEMSSWIRKETELARSEISGKLRAVVRNVSLVILGALILYTGIIIVAVALALGAGELLTFVGLSGPAKYIAGFSAVGVVIMISGRILLQHSKNKLSQAELMPGQTAESLRETKNWAKEKIQ
ncbi:MAG: phage holin family protein [Verrucomicrobiales bacterium]|nr:phage holin family protein [Verrucomicrobiales bacterium]